MVYPGVRRSCVSSLRPAESECIATHPCRSQSDWRKLSLSLAGACLPASRQDPECDLSASVYLPLRPGTWAYESAQLLRGAARHRVFDLRQGSFLRLPADKTGEDSGGDSCRYRTACLRGNRLGEAVGLSRTKFNFQVQNRGPAHLPGSDC